MAVGSGIGAFDIDHCIREDGTLNDTADTVLSIFPTAYVEKSPSGKGLRGFFHVPEDYIYDKTVYYINNRSKGLEVYIEFPLRVRLCMFLICLCRRFSMNPRSVRKVRLLRHRM